MVNVSFFFIYNQGYGEDVAARGAIGEHYRERRSIPYIKKDTRLSVFYKNGDDLLSHKSLQYHRRCWA